MIETVTAIRLNRPPALSPAATKRLPPSQDHAHRRRGLAPGPGACDLYLSSPVWRRNVESSGRDDVRYTKAALLIFGFGMLGGLAVVSAGRLRWGWAASAAMALGLALIPVGLVLDLRRSDIVARLTARLRRRKPVRKPSPRRKPAAEKRRPPPRKKQT
jgi:hypothetical protein